MADVVVSIGVVLSELRDGLGQGSRMLDQFTKDSKRAREGASFFANSIRDIGGASSGAGAAVSGLLAGFAMGGPMGLAIGGVQALVGYFKDLRKEQEENARAAKTTAKATADAWREVAEVTSQIHVAGLTDDRAVDLAKAASDAARERLELIGRIHAAEDDLAKAIKRASEENDPHIRWAAQERVDGLRKALAESYTLEQANAARINRVHDENDAREKDREAEKQKQAAARQKQAADEKVQRENDQENRVGEVNEEAREREEAAQAAADQREIDQENRVFEARVALEEKAAQRQQQALGARAQQYEQYATQVGSAISSGLEGVMTEGAKVSQVIENIFKNLARSAVTFLIQLAAKKVAASIAGHIAEKPAKMADVTAAAGVAGANAAAAVAGIPVVGPALAAAQLAAMPAAVMGAMMPLASAAGGWQLPNFQGGLLMVGHGGEHMLPAWLAEKYERGAAAVSGESQGGTSLTFNVSTIDSKSFVDQLRNADGELAKLLKELVRNGGLR